jgi:hypothetical protein
MKSWLIEGSLDGVKWTVLDRRKDDTELNGYNKIISLPLSVSTECRFIRLGQKDVNHNGNNYLSLRAFEFFGTILEK